MKKYIYILFIIVALAAIFLLLNEKPAETLPAIENETFESDGETDFDAVSLPSMMEKEFDGRDLKLGKVLEDNASYRRYYTTYKSGELTISGIMNIPKGTVPEGGFPVLFLNHGHIDTSIYTNGRGLRREQDYLARQGFAILHSDLRNHAQSDKDPDNETDVRLGYVEDVINAVMAVKNSDIPSLSKDKLGMLGHSMGGGITQSIMVVKPELVDAFVLYAPVSSDVLDNYERWTRRNSPIAEKIRAKHGSPEENKEFWDNMSPKNFFDNVAGPVIIFHGTADESCDIEWSRTTRDLLAKAGKDVELVEYTGQPHEFSTSHTDFMQKTAQFFRDNLN